MDVGKDLQALTSIMEDQKLFDEMYLVRKTTMNTVYGCMGNLVVDPEAGYQFRVKAQEMLMEFYSKDKIPELTQNKPAQTQDEQSVDAPEDLEANMETALGDCYFNPIFAEAEKYKQQIMLNIKEIAENFTEENKFAPTGNEPGWLLLALREAGAKIEAEETSKSEVLVGKHLLKALVSISNGSEEDLLEASGYSSFEELVAAVNTAKEEVLTPIFSRMGVLVFSFILTERVLSMEPALDVDESTRTELLEKQSMIASDLEQLALDARAYGGKDLTGMTITDSLGVIIDFFAYTEVGRPDPTNPDETEEENKDRYYKIVNWAREIPAIKRMREIADEGFTAEEIKDYDEFREPHHSQIATCFRTCLLDFLYDSDRKNVPGFDEAVADAKVFLSMLSENSEWTPYVLSCGFGQSALNLFEHTKDRAAVTEFVIQLIDNWIEEGNDIRNSSSGKPDELTEVSVEPISSLKD